MKVEVYKFFRNNRDLEVEDIISKIRIGKTSDGLLTILKFNSVDRYHYVLEEGNGRFISIQPIIYSDGTQLYETCFDDYLDHPDYYLLQLEVEVPDSEVIVMPLKYEYQINFIPHSMIFGNVNLEPVELE